MVTTDPTAKAAKARPWWRKKRWWLTAVILIALIAIGQSGRKTATVAKRNVASAPARTTHPNNGASRTHSTTVPPTSSTAPPTTQAPTTTQSAAANPTGAPVTLAMGQSAPVYELGAPIVDLSVGDPVVSSNPITPSGFNSSTPTNGYFATFTLSAKDVSATQSYPFAAVFFYVQVAGSGVQYSTATGNGARANQFGNTYSATLNPGELASDTVTFDIPAAHGWVVYAPNNQPLGAWRF